MKGGNVGDAAKAGAIRSVLTGLPDHVFGRPEDKYKKPDKDDLEEAEAPDVDLPDDED